MAEKTKFIAEVSSNHHRNLERCLEFVKTSAQIGCDAVKFQLFKIDQLFAPEILSRSKQHRERKNWELPISFLADIASCCREQNIEFSCTPFYLDAVVELEPYVDFYKIASYELLWDDLLKVCAASGKPVVLSTGMATLPEIEHAVAVIREAGCLDLTLLHCVSSYPTPAEQCNLAVLSTLQKKFACQVGWSDHSVNPAVIFRAVHRWQAGVVEFHLDLDQQGEEYPAGHCWLPQQIQPVIETVRSGFLADGDGVKRTAACENADRDWRADPVDGLRPLRKIRNEWHDNEQA